MFKNNYDKELNRRKTFAIISHPDAGKTTLTEKMLLFGKVIHVAGTIKGRGNKKYAKSDWMNIEKARGISVTTSVMQFTYKNILINLLDTPGHQDFSEDTYRILTAVDCCLVIVDAAKGVEERTRKLIEVTRVHNTPIITFINKLDRDSRDPIELIDEIEKEFKMHGIPITWPISCGKNFQGVYHIYDKKLYFYKHKNIKRTSYVVNDISDFSNAFLKKVIGIDLSEYIGKELELIMNIFLKFQYTQFLKAMITPIFFGSALGNFGIDHLLNGIIQWAPSPLHRQSNKRLVYPQEKKFTGFVFKIQANMNLKHRDRIAFIRIVSGQYQQGMKLKHVRINKYITISNAYSFLAGERILIQQAYPGDVIGLHNYGTIKIGDTFTEGEEIKFIGIPSFAPEIFRQISLKNPLKQKQLKKSLIQLSEEGTVQVFRPIINNHLILGAIGILQFDVVIERLKIEYNIDAIYEKVNIILARWISAKNHHILDNFTKNYSLYIAYDNNNNLIYLAPSISNLNIVMKKNSDIFFTSTREQE